MKKPDVIFAYDFDSDLYMLSEDPDARSWTVIVHSSDGSTHTSRPEKFSPYPGCETHEGKTAWIVEYFRPVKIEIQRPDSAPVIMKHPDA